jgi:hypothetical protein
MKKLITLVFKLEGYLKGLAKIPKNVRDGTRMQEIVLYGALRKQWHGYGQFNAFNH